MFPQLKLTPTRAAFARPGPDATPFPDVSAPMQPSDSLAPFGRRSGLPSPTAYLGAQGLFFAAAPVPTQTRATSETLLPRLPVSRLSPQGETRVSQVPGPSSSCVPWSSTPPGATAPRPLSVRLPSSSGELKPWTPGKLPISWLHNPRPTRSRTYASPNPLPSPAQGSLPARAGSPLAGRVSHPLDDKQGFMKSSHTPLLLDQPCLVALILGTNLPTTPATPLRRAPAPPTEGGGARRQPARCGGAHRDRACPSAAPVRSGSAPRAEPRSRFAVLGNGVVRWGGEREKGARVRGPRATSTPPSPPSSARRDGLCPAFPRRLSSDQRRGRRPARRSAVRPTPPAASGGRVPPASPAPERRRHDSSPTPRGKGGSHPDRHGVVSIGPSPRRAPSRDTASSQPHGD